MSNIKILNRTMASLVLILALTACGGDDTNKENGEVTPETSLNTTEDTSTPPSTDTPSEDTSIETILDTQLIDVCTLPKGETLTLENRNDHVDYIIDCVYHVKGDLIIAKNVTIEFGTDAGISVEDGSLQVNGEKNSLVVLTGQDKTKGAWRGVIVDSDDTKNLINYAKIEYAGGESFNSNGDKGAIIIWADTKLKVTNSMISNSETYGINANYGGDELVLQDNNITSCSAPMYLEALYPNIISGGEYTGNDIDAIIVTTADINHDAIWKNLGVPYHIIDGLKVIAGGGKLTIQPGVIMEFGLDVQLYVNEGGSGSKPSFIAIGTEDNPITFTGINKVKGAWKGIYFDSPSPLNEIAFTNIEYASNPEQEGAIFTWYNTVLNIHDVNFNHIQRDAIHIKKFASDLDTISRVNNTFSDVDGININITN